MIEEVTLVIPSYNNQRHLRNCYKSIRKWYPDVKLILIDDGSKDGTDLWLVDQSIEDKNLTIQLHNEKKGHTVRYDEGIDIAETSVVGILHADMIMGPNYLHNCLKNLERGRVVCGTRVEPPLHPSGPEKITKDFGTDFDNLKLFNFYQWCYQAESKYSSQTTNGMFAPWLLYKEDFEAIGGHDWNFAPYPHEDADIFLRWHLAGYELIQARDAFVYHLTCRGHRWTEQVGKDDAEYEHFERKARHYYIKKWGSWMKFDSLHHPIAQPVLDKAVIVLKEADIKSYEKALLTNFFSGNYFYDDEDFIDPTKLEHNLVTVIEDRRSLDQLKGLLGDFNSKLYHLLHNYSMLKNVKAFSFGLLRIYINGDKLEDRKDTLIHAPR